MGLIIIPPPDDGGGGVVDGPVAAYAYELTGAYTTADSLELKVARLAALTEAFQAGDSLDQQLTIIVELTEETTVGDSTELTASLLAELLDSVNIYGLFKTVLKDANGDVISDGSATWVLNTEGEQPISEYDNYNFNSLTYYQGQLYGTDDTGLYTLSGADDAGSAITAELSSLMLDFGTSRQKRMRSAYLGYTSDDQLVLKVRSVSDGQLYERWYTACPATATAPREGRINVGLGMRSRYWQFELTNVNGCDFEIDQLELYPLVLTRRV